VDLPKPEEQVRSPTAVARSLEELLGDGEAAATAIHDGQRLEIPAAGLTIGRETDNDVVVSTALASRHHARIVRNDGRWFLADLDSTNGTFLNGERLRGQARFLQSGDAIVVGGETIHFVVDEPETDGGAGVVSRIPLVKRLTVGRDAGNDVQLDGPAVAGLHAEIVMTGDRVEVIDHGSRSGTRVDGTVVERAELVPGAEVGIGPYRLVFDGKGFIPKDDTGALRLEAESLTVSARGKVLLDRVSLEVGPGELVAVVGESGAGKSTLLKLLAGVSRPTSGTILLSGDPVQCRLTEVGYLPQDEIVHPRLTVVESLRYSARLRLPHDSSDEEIEAAVRRAVAAVSLEHVADQRVAELSGGQRKRVGLATELLSHPGILFLDEPTTGLDVGLERQMMDLFRSLAVVGDHAVVVVTHATHSLHLVDTICVMGRGGHLCFAGSPAETLEFFSAETFEDVYLALQKRPAVEWREDFERRRGTAAQPETAAPLPAPVPPRRHAGIRTQAAHAATLTSRYVNVFLRDRINLAILLLQAPVLGVSLLLLFQRDLFAPADEGGTPLVATQLVFLLAMITIWLGAVDASREIVKEKAIFARERAMGVGIGPYLVSKMAVLFSLILVQAAILIVLTAILRPFHEPFSTYLEVFGIVCAAGFVSVGMGLLISCVAQNEDQATALAPIAMTAQLFFSGGIVTVKSMTGFMAAVSTTAFGRWTFQGMGTSLHMNARFLSDPASRTNNQYGYSFFNVGTGETFALLAVFAALFFGGIVLLLSRRKPG
jgi:ABC transport system ATP-binding/permease protein